MQVLETIPNALYPFSLILAGVIAFAIFVYWNVSQLTSKPEPGENPYAKIGGTFFGGMLLAYLAIGPIITYEQIFAGAQFPRPGFALAWWIAMAIIVIMGIALMLKDFSKHRKLVWLQLLVYLFLAMVSAAWVAKTVNVISHAFTVSTLAGILFGLLGVIYIVLYALTPFMLVSFALDKLRNVKSPKTKATQAMPK